MGAANPHNQDLKLAVAALYLLHERSRFRRILRASGYDVAHARLVYNVVRAVTGARAAQRFLR